MGFLDSLQQSASGLKAQRLRMKLIAENLANVNTTRGPGGEVYRRKEALFHTEQSGPDFKSVLHSEVIRDPRPPVMKYEPSHPEADAEGYVAYPDINLVEEMVNMMSAARSFEANVTAVTTAKDMAMKALEIGK